MRPLSGEADPIADALSGVKPPGRNAVDPALAPPTCSVIVSCGLETSTLERSLAVT